MTSTYQDLPEEEGSALDLKVLVLYGLFRSKYWVIGLTAVGLVAGLVLGASAPNEYESEARLRYVPGERDKLTDDDLAGLDSIDRRHAAPGITDEIMMLENPLIYQRAAERIGASAVLELPDPTADGNDSKSLPVRVMHGLQKWLIDSKQIEIDDRDPRAMTGAARRLRGSTTLATARDAATIRVLVRAYSPEKAQRFCEVLVEAFQERHREVFSAEARLEDQRQKVVDAREKYQKLETDWNMYRSECGVFDYHNENSTNQDAVRALEKKLEEREGERRKLLAKIKVYEERLGQIKEFVAERTDAVVGENPAYVNMRQNIMEIEHELILLVDGSLPPVTLAQRRKNYEAQRDRLQEELEHLTMTIVLLPERTEQRKNPEYYEVQSRLVELRSERDGVIADIEYLTDNRDGLGADRKRIAACKDKHFMHEALVKASRDDLTLQQDQLAKLEKLALAEMKGASALKPLWDPTLPVGKIGPSRAKPLLMGLAAGLFLGLAIAIARQLIDRRLRYPETLANGLGLRVLGVVPEARKLRNLRRSVVKRTAA